MITHRSRQELPEGSRMYSVPGQYTVTLTNMYSVHMVMYVCDTRMILSFSIEILFDICWEDEPLYIYVRVFNDWGMPIWYTPATK
jgi:hypothetical protein